jgi:hypothetical protein
MAYLVFLKSVPAHTPPCAYSDYINVSNNYGAETHVGIINTFINGYEIRKIHHFTSINVLRSQL